MSFLRELKRRNVLRVATAYLFAAWLVVQVVETILPAFGFSDFIIRVTVVLLAIGLVPALVLSWVFAFTRDGLRREADDARSDALRNADNKRFDRIIILLLTLALGYFAVDKFLLDPARDRQQLETALREGRSGLGQETFAEKSIVVLPFVNMSSDTEQEYFSDGLTEELLNLLARVPGLRVISRSSAFAFKHRNIKVSDIATELKVGYVLEGSVRMAGNRLRITTQLIDAASDQHVWSESYERPLEDIFAIQDEIAAAVLPQIQLQLGINPPKAARADAAAYALYLQALHFFQQRTGSGLELALDHVTRAIDIDAGFAPAWTLLGSVHINRVNLGAQPAADGFERASAAIEKALELAPDYAFAHSARAWIAMSREGDLMTAAAHFRRARELAPGNAVVIGNSAVLAVTIGRLHEALRLTDRAIALDPVNSVAFGNRADQLIRLGRLEEAEKAARESLELNPSSSYAQGSLALIRLLQERPAAAAELAESLENRSVRLAILAMARHSLGETEKAAQSLAALESEYASSAAYLLGICHAWLRDADTAFAWLQRAIEEKQSVFGILTEPFLRTLHGDPRWSKILQQAGLAEQRLGDIVL